MEDRTPVYSGTGFSAVAIAKLSAGSEIDVLSSKKVNGSKWLCVSLPDGQMGYLPGDTKIVGGSLSNLNAWKNTERSDAARGIVLGGICLGAGVAAIALMLVMIESAVRSREEIVFPFKPVCLLAIGAILYGGFRILGGIVEYFQSYRD